LDRYCTFSEAALLTREAGIVITTRHGAEFQITIIRSK